MIPAELWQETGRWDKFGPQLLKIRDRHERDFLFGPTHEEPITDIVRKDIRSYRQLPVNLYQIQVKFRDEIRPRFGVMRGREFLMKDAYSFDADRDALMRSYRAMYEAYERIFTRLGLKFRAVEADTGAIGGFASHEFQVLADAGEDAIAWCPQSDYAANVEQAEALAPTGGRPAPAEALRKVPTPTQTTCEEVTALLGLPLSRSVKCLLVWANERVNVLLVRGDHMGNEVKITLIATGFDQPDAGFGARRDTGMSPRGGSGGPSRSRYQVDDPQPIRYERPARPTREYADDPAPTPSPFEDDESEMDNSRRKDRVHSISSHREYPLHPNECPDCHGFWCKTCNATIPARYRPFWDEDEKPEVIAYYKRQQEEAVRRNCHNCSEKPKE